MQVTAQDVSTMMRFDANPVIFLVNNSGYAIEILIHDGPYNQIMVGSKLRYTHYIMLAVAACCKWAQ